VKQLPIFFTYFPGFGIDASKVANLDHLYDGKTHHLHGSPAFWNDPVRGPMLFVWGENESLRAWTIDQSGKVAFTAKGAEVASAGLGGKGGMPGGLLAVTSNAHVPNTGIVWALAPVSHDANRFVVEGILRAYDASNLDPVPNLDGTQRLKLLWDSKHIPGNQFKHNKFCPPVVKVTICWRSNVMIAALSGIATGAGVTIGQTAKIHAGHLGWGSAPEIIGRGILAMIGIWTLIAYFRSRLYGNLQRCLIDQSSDIGGKKAACPSSFRVMSLSEGAISGTALAIDNIGPSFAFGLVNPGHNTLGGAGPLLALFTAALSLAYVWLAQTAKMRGQNLISWVSPEIVSGCLIIGIAILDPSDIGFRLFALNP
jgi:putative Mn2+ efflux pump MntP